MRGVRARGAGLAAGAAVALLAGCAGAGPAGLERTSRPDAGQQAAQPEGVSKQEAVGQQGPAAVVATPADTSGYSGVWLDVPYAKPKLTFTDTSGRPFHLAQRMTHPVTLVFFGYTSCTDVCNTVLADVAMALRRAEPAVREKTQLVFITTDPKRDTPAVLRAYLNQFNPAFIGLTGSMSTIERAATSLGVAVMGEHELPGGGYEVGHSAQLIGFAPDGLGRLVWVPDRLTVGGLRADLGRLTGVRS